MAQYVKPREPFRMRKQLLLLFLLAAALLLAVQAAFLIGGAVRKASPTLPDGGPNALELLLKKQAAEKQEENDPKPEPAGPEAAEPAPSEQEEAAEPAPEPKPARIALTFDDGPSAYTSRLLDGLAEHGAKATFFVLGSRVSGREELLNRMAAEGHEIGNHSWSHPQFKSMSEGGISGEIVRTADAIEKACGKRPYLVRPPYGDVSAVVRRALGEPLILWSVDPRDWSLRNTDKVVNAVLSKVSDGDIVLLHDIYSTSVDAALAVIDRLAEEYDFVTVSQLFEEAGTPLAEGNRYSQAGPRKAAQE